MKKIIVYILCLCFTIGCTNSKTNIPTTSNFCDEESNSCGLENTEDTNESDVFIQITMQEAINMFTEKKEGILYFGYPDCPWCREVQPILKKVSKQYNKKIYYIRTRDDNKERLYSDKEKELILPYLKEYLKQDEKGEYQLYVPFVISMKNGEVLQAHLGTVKSHDANERTMTESEKLEVEDIYNNIMLSIKK